MASTHGHEIGWVMLPVGRQAMRRIGSRCDVVTYLGEYTRGRLARALGAAATLRASPRASTPSTSIPEWTARQSGRATDSRIEP